MENIIYWIIVVVAILLALLIAITLIFETPQEKKCRKAREKRRIDKIIEKEEAKKLERWRAQRRDNFDVMRDIYGVDD